MKKTIEMPEVMGCEQNECAYNLGSLCHARGITVGGMQDHLCDTMMPSGSHTHRKETAGVGACRTRNCVHNEDWECRAEGINITLSGGQALCGTFAAG